MNTCFVGEGMSFAEYVRRTAGMLRQAHDRLGTADAEKVVSGNAPFELHPSGEFQAGSDKPYRRGVLLVHGLTDSPYFMRHLAAFFQREGFRVMAVLLPGHGTQPGDLLDMRWQEWGRAVAYGADCLSAEADEIYLAGFSAGATLSVLRSRQDERVRGLFLFSPAFEISPRAAWANLHKLYSWLLPQTAWVSVMPDRDPYKYESFCRNAAAQMHALTRALPQGETRIPVFTAASADDATVHAGATLRFMRQARHPDSRLVWYAKEMPQENELCRRQSEVSSLRPTGGWVEWVNSALPAQRILSSAHTAIVLPPEDAHYGAAGDYVNCLHYYPDNMDSYAACASRSRDFWLGEVNGQNLGCGLLCRLMYNPHYAEMEASMRAFIEGLP